jgi:hypothetical protein
MTRLRVIGFPKTRIVHRGTAESHEFLLESTLLSGIPDLDFFGQAPANSRAFSDAVRAQNKLRHRGVFPFVLEKHGDNLIQIGMKGGLSSLKLDV